jgi:hypothetical protein
LARVGVHSCPLTAAAAEPVARAASVAMVVFHRPTQLASHPRAAADAGHGNKVADVTAVAHDRRAQTVFFASWQKTVTEFMQAICGGTACPSLRSWRHRWHKWLPSLRGNFRRINRAKSTGALIKVWSKLKLSRCVAVRDVGTPSGYVS